MPVSLQKKRNLEHILSAPPPSANPLERRLLVVPTNRRKRYYTHELLKRGSAIPELPVFTLESLATRILQSSFENLRLVDEPIQTLLFGQAISAQKELKYFQVRGRRDQLHRGTFEKIISVIRNLKEAGVFPKTLSEELLSENESEQPKLRDIAAIYSSYESALDAVKGVDVEGIFTLLYVHCPQSQFEQAFHRSFPNVDTVSIVGFDKFTEPELGFLQRISALDIEVSILFDFQLGNDALFGHLEENYRRFIEMTFTPDNDGLGVLLPKKKSDDVRRITEHIAHILFSKAAVPQRLKSAGRVTVVKAKDRLCEVEFICKLIKQLITENNTPDLSRICVAMYKPQVYTHLVREQFKKYGIPANVTDRYELAQSPVVVSAIGLLEMVRHGYRREDILRTVGSAYCEYNNDGTPIDQANLMSVALELRIVGGIQSWVNKIEARMQKLRQEMALIHDEEENTRHARLLQRLNKAKSDISWLASLMREISLDQTPSQFLQKLQELLARVKISQRIVSIGAVECREMVEKDARAYAKFLEIVDQTVALLEYQEGADRKHALEFYVEQLKLAISQERYNVRERFGEGILVTSIDETRGLPLDTMIVVGLVDGEFPSVYQSELFFSKKRMKEREQRHNWENRYLFYQAITNWSEHLYLTYPEQHADLDLVRSSFIDTLLNIIEVEEWNYPDHLLSATTHYSEEDYLRFWGSQFASSRALRERTPDPIQEKTDYIERALTIERSRIDRHDLPEYEGMIGTVISAEAREKLHQLKARVYSVSQLETYGKCPYQFFAQRVLRLNVVEEFEEEFSPLEKGSVLHEILFEFYTERRDKNLPPLRECSEEEFAEAHQHLLRIAETKLVEIDIPDAFWELEKEMILGSKKMGQGTLSEFIEHERTRSTAMQPQFFEVGFGSKLGVQARTDKTFSSDEPVEAGRVLLRGKVDRVEIGNGAFAIVDYKTGKEMPKFEDIRAGISLQLPLYLYIIEKMFVEKAGDQFQPAGGLYYQLRSPVGLRIGVGSAAYKDQLEGRLRSNLVASNIALRGIINDAIAYANRYVDSISEGKFPLTSHEKIEKVCTYCEYKTICRIQTVHRVEKAKPEVS